MTNQPNDVNPTESDRTPDHAPTREPLARVLVVDDEPDLRALLMRYLTENGYAVRAAQDGAQMARILAREPVDLVVLDLMLPGEDGLAICRRLRSAGETVPILMLTARGEAVDRIIGLEMGADDYLPKPFNPRELLARIQAMLRRRVMDREVSNVTTERSITFGAFHLDLQRRTLTKAGEALTLTTGEFQLLRALAANPSRPLSRDQLATLMSEDGRVRERDAFDRSIDVHIVRLRKVIEDDTTKPRYIKTVWGMGYLFNPDGDATAPSDVQSDAPKPVSDGGAVKAKR
jgi:two-component system, OmpR family, phosphate regulon response regulator OmpR